MCLHDKVVFQQTLRYTPFSSPKSHATYEYNIMTKGFIVIKRFRKLTCEKEKDEDHNHRVAKVEDGAGSSNDLQLREEVVHAVDEQVDCCKATGQEGTPPPVIILEAGYKMLESPSAKN